MGIDANMVTSQIWNYSKQILHIIHYYKNTIEEENLRVIVQFLNQSQTLLQYHIK